MIKDLLILTIFPGAMVCAAASDLFTMTLPNRLALALVVCFFVVATLTGLGWYAVELHVALALAALAMTFTFFSLGWIGGGDAKLFAATCLWLGPAAVFTYSIYVTLFGFGLTLLVLLWRGLPLPGAIVLAKLAGASAQSTERAYLTESPWPRPDCSSIPPHLLWPHSGAELSRSFVPVPAERTSPLPLSGR